MSDLQIISVQDVIPIRRVTAISNSSPRIYRVQGPDFRNVTEVLLNGSPAPVFVVESATVLLVEEPKALRNDRLRDIMILSSTFTLTERSMLRPKLGTALLSGLMSLAQLFTKILLSTPGRDVYSPELGGNLLSLIGQVAGSPDRPDLKTSFIQAIARTKDQIMGIQANRTTLPADERLVSARVLSVSFEPQTGTLRGRVELISMAGTAALVNLVA